MPVEYFFSFGICVNLNHGQQFTTRRCSSAGKSICIAWHKARDRFSVVVVLCVLFSGDLHLLICCSGLLLMPITQQIPQLDFHIVVSASFRNLDFMLPLRVYDCVAESDWYIALCILFNADPAWWVPPYRLIYFHCTSWIDVSSFYSCGIHFEKFRF